MEKSTLDYIRETITICHNEKIVSWQSSPYAPDLYEVRFCEFSSFVQEMKDGDVKDFLSSLEI